MTDVTARIGISRKTVSAIVNGRAPVSVDMAFRLPRAFDTTPGGLPATGCRYVGSAADAWKLDADTAHYAHRVAPRFPGQAWCHASCRKGEALCRPRCGRTGAMQTGALPSTPQVGRARVTQLARALPVFRYVP